MSEKINNMAEETTKTVDLSAGISKKLSGTSTLDVTGAVGCDSTMQNRYYQADAEINSNRYNGGNSGPYIGGHASGSIGSRPTGFGGRIGWKWNW